MAFTVLPVGQAVSMILESFATSPLFPNGSYLVGDAGYPLLSCLMTPFGDNGHLDRDQRNYNYMQSSTRMVIERAFALLKGRFRRLKYADIKKTEDITVFILAACAMHNLCIFTEDEVEDMIDDDDDGDDSIHETRARSACSADSSTSNRAAA